MPQRLSLRAVGAEGTRASLGADCCPTLGAHHNEIQAVSFPIGDDWKDPLETLPKCPNRPAYLIIRLGFSFCFL